MLPRQFSHPYVMLAPSALLLVLFFFYPLGFAAYQSFYDWDLLTAPRWVGLANYTELFRSGALSAAFVTTLVFSVCVVTGSMLLGLALALALARPGVFASFVRGAVFSAYVVSWVSVALLWLWLLDPAAGAVTRLAHAAGLPNLDWLGDPRLSLYTLAGVTIWKIAGYAMVLFIAGLQDIPAALHEAAALDGARPWQRFAHVTWPLLRPTATFVGTTSLIASFQVFDVVRVMTQGGPVHSTTVFVYAIYEQIFLDLRVGRASAMVVVFFVLLLGLTLIELWAWQKRRPA
jgi:ABC-type sugar transport system permease subunit